MLKFVIVAAWLLAGFGSTANSADAKRGEDSTSGPGAPRTALRSADTTGAASSGISKHVCPDWPGLLSDSYHQLAYQVIGVAVMYFLPEEATGWTDEQKDWSFEKWLERIPRIDFDEDAWYFNFVQHPYWGAGNYVRASERGYKYWQAFLYSASLSVIHEFIVEAQFEDPSVQDLIVTPVAGSIVGECFMELRRYIKTRTRLRWYDKTLYALADPFGFLNLLIDHTLGIKTSETRCSLLLPGSRQGLKPPDILLNAAHRQPQASGLGIALQIRVTW